MHWSVFGLYVYRYTVAFNITLTIMKPYDMD